ncbi:hypothetical protein MMC25_007211 [Agyrium rufum]|nr:hypothetical protein [Agyrium rufum]
MQLQGPLICLVELLALLKLVSANCDTQVYISADRAASCVGLHEQASDHVLLQDSEAYRHISDSYWSAQQEVDYQPTCYLRPRSPQRLAEMVRRIVNERVPFAIKSGGHSFRHGASNINESGIAIDMSLINQIIVSQDERSVTVGVGAKWQDVYRLLEKRDLTVAGARAGGVGVGGFLLGGGVSWYANEIGWACDMVEEFHVILAVGKIVTANATTHKDLFRALKGGGSIFGLVVRVRLTTIGRTEYLGGLINYNSSHHSALLTNIADLSHRMSKTSLFNGYLMFTVLPDLPQLYCAVYFIDLTGSDSSPLLQLFAEVPYNWGNVHPLNMSDTALDLDKSNPRGFRQTKFALTLHADAALLKTTFDTFSSSTSSIKLEEGGYIGLSYTPFSAAQLSHTENSLGFSDREIPLILISVEIKWSSRSQDAYFERSAREIHDAMSEVARAMDMLHPFVYMNYAAEFQDPLGSYGKVAVERLRAVQDRYDHEHLFSDLQPGAFKLPKL